MDFRRLPLGKCVIASIALYIAILVWIASTSKLTLVHFEIPIMLVVVLGVYAVTSIAFGVYRFNRSDEGLEELKKDVARTRAKLEGLGYKLPTGGK